MNTYCTAAPGHPFHGPYHDREYGFPRRKDAELFERPILQKRDGFRQAYRGFDPAAVARFTGRDITRLMADADVIRNRLKIEAAVHNARVVLDLRESHGSFAKWLDAHHPLPKPEWLKLFKTTFRFTGGEIVGEFLMSLGYLPGAHAPDCPVYQKVLVRRPPWLRFPKPVA